MTSNEIFIRAIKPVVSFASETVEVEVGAVSVFLAHGWKSRPQFGRSRERLPSMAQRNGRLAVEGYRLCIYIWYIFNI